MSTKNITPITLEEYEEEIMKELEEANTEVDFILALIVTILILGLAVAAFVFISHNTPSQEEIKRVSNKSQCHQTFLVERKGLTPISYGTMNDADIFCTTK